MRHRSACRLAGWIAAASLAAGCGSAQVDGGAKAVQAGDEAAAAVRKIADEYVDGMFAMFPEWARQSGVDDPRYDSGFSNLAPESLARWRAEEDAWLARIKGIDLAALEGRPEWAAREVVREQLEVSIAKRACREELWGVKQMWGWQENLSYAAASQPVGTPEARERAIARWKRIPGVVRTEIANLRKGLGLGYSSPQGNVRLVIGQMDALLAAPMDGYLLEPAKRDGDPEFQKALGAIVSGEIVPAVKEYRDFLAGEYLRKARDAVSVEANPDGKACYLAYLRDGNGMPLSPQEIHRIGLEQVDALMKEVAAIGARSFGTPDPEALFVKIRTEPQYLYKDRDDVFRCAQAAVARAKELLPSLVGRVPRADVEVRRTPPERDDGTDMSYRAPTQAGLPGTFWISSANAEREPRAECETVAWHETIPGHHLQNATALERGEEISSAQRYLWSIGFGEGWALYAERMMYERDAFTSDLQRFGFLSDQLLRASRLVVDTGMHDMGWSRDQAISYMLAHTDLSETGAANEIDRYLIYPGQATGYMIGMLTILKVRDDARARLGARFDLREFNDRVLELGNVPLPVMDAHVRAWLEKAAAQPGQAR
jgi:uncharacterized protein (DUF885 family)